MLRKYKNTTKYTTVPSNEQSYGRAAMFMNRSIFLWNIILIHQNALLLFNWHQTREVITDHLMEISTK